MYRSIVVGLLGAMLYVLVARQTIVVMAEPPAPVPVEPEPEHAALRVVDVASSLTADTLYDLVGLGRGELITEIDDLVMVNGAEARSTLELRSRERGYLDVTVDDGVRERRVILLVH